MQKKFEDKTTEELIYDINYAIDLGNISAETNNWIKEAVLELHLREKYDEETYYGSSIIPDLNNYKEWAPKSEEIKFPSIGNTAYSRLRRDLRELDYTRNKLWKRGLNDEDYKKEMDHLNMWADKIFTEIMIRRGGVLVDGKWVQKK